MLRALTILVFLCPCGALSQEEWPFWRQKSRLMKQITGQRRIVVSVKREQQADGKVFRIVGAGAVSAPLDHCVDSLKKMEDLQKVSSAFHVIKHRPAKKQAYLVLRAAGYQARLLLKYKFRGESPMIEQMDWRIIWGTFKGMEGNFIFRTLSSRQTEISLWAKFSGETLPFPDFFLKFTLEVITEKVAQKMRTYLEGSYRDTLKKRRR